MSRTEIGARVDKRRRAVSSRGVGMGRTTTRKQFPELPSDRPWREQVLQWISDHDLSQEEFASQIGVSQGAISDTLNEENKGFRVRTSFVVPISEHTGIGLPLAARLEIAGKELANNGTPDQYRSIVEKAEALAEALTRGGRSRKK